MNWPTRETGHLSRWDTPKPLQHKLVQCCPTVPANCPTRHFRRSEAMGQASGTTDCPTGPKTAGQRRCPTVPIYERHPWDSGVSLSYGGDRRDSRPDRAGGRGGANDERADIAPEAALLAS